MLELEQVVRYACFLSTQLLNKSGYNLGDLSLSRVLIIVVGKADSSIFLQPFLSRNIFNNVRPA
jgi:hypothetical protein